MHFANQTVIVTGGTGALGRAVVGTLLARARAAVFPTSSRRRPRRFPTRTASPWSAHCELTNEADVARLYDGVTDLWASIHIAGGFAMGSVADTDKAGMLHMLNMNFVSCYLCCRAAVQNFGPGGGRIVNVAARPGWNRGSAPAWRPTPQARPRWPPSPRRWQPRWRGAASW